MFSKAFYNLANLQHFNLTFLSLNYIDNRTVIPFAGFGGSRERINSGGSDKSDRSAGYTRRPVPNEASPPPTLMYAQSPSNMEGPITFVAPELSEETLMDVRTIFRVSYN